MLTRLEIATTDEHSSAPVDNNEAGENVGSSAFIWIVSGWFLFNRV
jgi:hypothetical protein